MTFVSILLSLQADEQITLTWQFTGKGDLTCNHGDEVIVPCASPLVITPKPLADDTTTIAVSISFVDSCGTTKKAEFTYSKAGVQVISKVDDPAVIPPEITPGAGGVENKTDVAKKNAGTVPTATGALSTFGLGLFSAVALFALL